MPPHPVLGASICKSKKHTQVVLPLNPSPLGEFYPENDPQGNAHLNGDG
jgi:hypothetical protein